ncbi:aspartate dehydrogenase [Brucella pseudogrignonensis]|uniref:L-aspartate dehydrogenase n=1 Tax=Brucella pseudogrignonensis TaxID=419475 RepID=A0ABU1MDV8_9HYPH|nr:aspartate dehydrogenase [Brucella pseudogrignonensis]MDR6434233.1 aspartate dehydrogenase [Brucella pseudogrignonensis]
MSRQLSSDQFQSDATQPRVIGLIGFGAIARELLTRFTNENVRWIVYTRSAAVVDDAECNITFVQNLDELIQSRPCIVVEAAAQSALRDQVPAILEAGISVIAASVGAFADETLVSTLDRACRETNASLIFPSGAVGGLDYLSAIAPLEDVRIRYTSRKPPAAWKAELEERNLVCDGGALILFEGSSQEAARLYPKNLNAALTISLAIRPHNLEVRVLVDPDAKANTHEIEVESAAGTAFIRLENVPSELNPKTSMITALSLASSLRKFLETKGSD